MTYARLVVAMAGPWPSSTTARAADASAVRSTSSAPSEVPPGRFPRLDEGSRTGRVAPTEPEPSRATREDSSTTWSTPASATGAAAAPATGPVAPAGGEREQHRRRRGGERRAPRVVVSRSREIERAGAPVERVDDPIQRDRYRSPTVISRKPPQRTMPHPPDAPAAPSTTGQPVSAPGREPAGQLDDAVVGGRLADGDADAVAGERADGQPSLVRGSGEPDACGRRAASQQKLACVSGTSQPSSPSPVTTRARSATQRVDPLQQLGLGARSEATAAACASRRRRTAAPPCGAPPRPAPAPRRTRPAARPARTPWRRSGAAPRRCRGSGRPPRRRRRPGRGRTRRTPRRRDQDVGRHPVEEGVELAWRTAGPVGLLGVQTSTSRVRSVIAAAMASRSCRAVGGQRHRHGAPPAGGDRDRVRLEGPPGVDHLVAGLAHRLHQVVEHRDRPGRRARSDAAGRAGADRRVQRGARHVRVAVHRTGGGVDAARTLGSGS